MNMLGALFGAATMALAGPSLSGSSAQTPSPTSLTVEKAFHVVGAPGLKRNARVDLEFTETEMILRAGRRPPLHIPFKRIEKTLFLSGERHYGKTLIPAVAAFGVAGTLVMLKKRKVDTFVVDFRNERGGLMGLVVQLPLKDGDRCAAWLSRFEVPVEEPEIEKPPQ